MKVELSRNMRIFNQGYTWGHSQERCRVSGFVFFFNKTPLFSVLRVLKLALKCKEKVLVQYLS